MLVSSNAQLDPFSAHSADVTCVKLKGYIPNYVRLKNYTQTNFYAKGQTHAEINCRFIRNSDVVLKIHVIHNI